MPACTAPRFVYQLRSECCSSFRRLEGLLILQSLALLPDFCKPFGRQVLQAAVRALLIVPVPMRFHTCLGFGHRNKDHAPQNFAVLRRIALNLLRRETTHKRGIKAKQKRAGWGNAYLTRLLTN